MFLFLITCFLLSVFSASAQEPAWGTPAKADSTGARFVRARQEFREAVDRILFIDFMTEGLKLNTLVRTAPYMQYPAVNVELGAYLDTFEQETGATVIIRAYIESTNPWAAGLRRVQRVRKAAEISRARPAHAVIDIVYTPTGFVNTYDVAGYTVSIRDSLRTPAFNALFGEHDFLRMRDTLQAALGTEVKTVDSLGFNAAVIRGLEALKGDTRTGPDPGYRVIFRQGSAAGYDAYRYPTLAGSYRSDASNNPIPWIAIDAHKSHTLHGRYEVSDPVAAKETPLKIEAEGLAVVPHTVQDTVITQELIPAGSARELMVSAGYRRTNRFNGGVDTVAGQVAVAAYEPVNKRVVIVRNAVSVSSADPAEVRKALDEVYGQAVVNWEVTVTDNFRYDYPVSFETATSTLAKYSREMNAVIRAFKKGRSIDGSTYYIFMVPGFTGSTTGFMPFNGQFGFVSQEGDYSHFIAHELGHGAFNLRHTFSDRGFVAAQSTTDNIMDYGSGTRLYKYQWDMLHNPEAVLLPGLESDEEAMLSMIIINEKYTRLFNHVYDNNLKPNNTTYTKAYHTKDWDKEWTYGDSKPEELVDKVLDKIKVTGDGLTIPKITLRDNGIYVGKHKVGDKEYAAAIYSRKAEISNIKKVKIVELSDLKTASIRKHLYSESTYYKYLVVAFYEDGETEPSLMIQAAKDKFELFSEAHLEAWMRYVGVMEDEKKGNTNNFEIQLFDGDKLSGRDSVMLITTEPKMPDIKVKPVAKTGEDEDKEVELRLQIAYQRDGVDKNGSAVSNVRDDISSYPADGWKKVKMDEEWDIDFGQDIRGGTVYLLCRYDEKTDTIKFYIRGANPTETEIKNYMNQKGYISQYWFIVRMTRQESSMLQFGNRETYQTEKLTRTRQGKGEPTYGPPKGFGLKQLDNWGGTETIYASEQHLWDWKTNIDGGVEVIKEKKTYVDNARKINDEMIRLWNEENPTSLVSDSVYIDAGEGAGTTVLTITEGDITFSVSPTGTQKDIYDARWIKLFNGALNPYYQVLGGGNIKPRRVVKRTNNSGKNYVKDVCSQPD